MALPLKKLPPETLGPKIIPMPVYDNGIEDVAEEDVAFVLQQATAPESPNEVDQTPPRPIEDLRSLAEKDPLQFIAIVAVASFVIGFGLRLWRSSRA